MPIAFVRFFFFPLSTLTSQLSLPPRLPTPPPRHQANAAALERLYDSMALETETLGLDSAAIRSLWSFYRSVTTEERAAGGGGGAVVTGRRRHQKRTTEPSAKRYSEFSPPLAPGAIRLLLFFLDGEGSDCDPGADLLRAAGDAAVRAALAELEALDGEEEEAEKEERNKGKDVDSSPFPSLASAFHATPGRHMTVFQASHPASVVPDSTSFAEEDGEGEKEKVEEEGNSGGGGGNGGGKSTLLGAPPEGALAREIAAAREAALAVGAPPRLVAHRVFLARSGALLLTLTEEAEGGGEEGKRGEEEMRGEEEKRGESRGGGRGRRQGGGRVAALRQGAALRMPRASKRQPAILHVTLGRLLARLPAGAAARVSKAAEEAAKPFLLRAKESRQAWVPSFLAHVVEDTFASVDGESVLLPFERGCHK